LAAPPFVQILDSDRLDARLLAEDRAAERLIGKGCRPEIVEDDVARRIERFAELLEDHVLLALELRAAEVRA
jgi:hypothetical protein